MDKPKIWKSFVDVWRRRRILATVIRGSWSETKEICRSSKISWLKGEGQWLDMTAYETERKRQMRKEVDEARKKYFPAYCSCSSVPSLLRITEAHLCLRLKSRLWRKVGLWTSLPRKWQQLLTVPKLVTAWHCTIWHMLTKLWSMIRSASLWTDGRFGEAVWNTQDSYPPVGQTALQHRVSDQQVS